MLPSVTSPPPSPVRDLRITDNLEHDGASLGFYGTGPVAQPTGVAVTAQGIHDALVAIGLITA